MIKISDGTFYVGVNDRRKALFENMWPLPKGVAYNSYIIVDEKTALIDTVEHTVANNLFEKIDSVLQGKNLDYLIINHMEPDHSGAISELLIRYPNLQIVGNSKTFKVLEAYFGITKNLVEVNDGSELNLGKHTLTFYMTPWLHWPETMMTYDKTTKALFTGDAFGSFGTLDGGIFDDEIDFERDYKDEMLRYYSNIVGKYSNMVQKALPKLNGVDISVVCSTHGPIWRSNPGKVIELYNKWSKHESENGVVIAFASMYGNTEEVADSIARKLVERGVRNVKVIDVSKTHVSFTISEIWKYKGVILGSCAYNTDMHPMMAQLCHELSLITPKNKVLGLFGSFSWSGGGVKTLKLFAEKIGWEQPAEAIEINGIPNNNKLECCDKFTDTLAPLLK